MVAAIFAELMPRMPGVLVCWLYAGAIGTAAVYGQGAPIPVRILIALACIAAGAGSFWHAISIARRTALGPAPNDASGCPACSYPLVRDGDGRRWCPECGLNARTAKVGRARR